MELTFDELRDFLNEKSMQYNNPEFILHDPIQIPHQYTEKEDIEVAGFLTATISWGNRKSILKSAKSMMDHMGNSPYDFVINHTDEGLQSIYGSVHRTFHAIDFIHFIKALRHLYLHEEGLEGVFNRYQTASSLQTAIHQLKKHFFSIPHQNRTQKHIPDPMKGSAAKRINMFLRWMIRKDNAGVDFGLWKRLSPAKLSCPLDVHTGSVARKLGLLTRNQNDAMAVRELDTVLRRFDPEDPVRYDYALFGLGSFERF